MADKLEGTAIIANTVSGDRIVTGSITTTQLAPSVAAFVNEGQPLKIRTITYPGNDTAANTGGGQTITLTGTGFKQNVQVYINSNAVPSVTYANANSISFTAPALAAATYPVYVINTDDGATAILIPGIQYSGTPTWTTTTPLTTQDASIAWNIQLVATSDSTVSYSLQAGSSLPAGITLAANGLISGTMSSPPADETTYNFTVVAVDLEQQDASRAFSVSVTVSVLDPYFTYTTLLLHGDGTNNANNHAFVDSSNNNFTITRNGNATQGTFSPFGDNWSNYFDGSGDYLGVAASAANDFGTTTDYTIEFWVNFSVNASNGNQYVYDMGANGSRVQLYQNALYLFFTSNQYVSQSYFGIGEWVHIALCRSGSTGYGFVNGQLIGTTTANGAAGTSGAWRICEYGGAGNGLVGYVSNFRIIRGTALYTSSFTPSTQPLTSVSNTSLLTCQSNAFVDKGPNRLAITRNGDARVTKFDPFKPYKAIFASYGVYFDGSGDQLTIGNNAAFELGSGDFSYEAWVYALRATNTYSQGILSYGIVNNLGASTCSLDIAGATGYLSLAYATGSVYTIADNAVFPLNQWVHVVACRTGSTISLFKNGVRVATATTSATVGTGGTFSIAGQWYANEAARQLHGHISNARVLKGASAYDATQSTIIVPTSPLTAVANTQLLTCQSTAIIDNSTNAFTITRNGDARPTDLNPFTTTFVSEKYNTANGGGAVYLDGTGDYLDLPANTAWALGTNGSFEAWVYPLAYGSNLRIYSNVNNQNYIDAYVDSSGIINFSGGTLTTSTTIPLYAWTHIAFVLNAGVAAVYINGRSVAISGTTEGLNYSNNNALSIGRLPSASGYEWNGYISSARLVKGTVTYRNNFVPPTEPPTNIANTSFLCNFTNAGILDSVGKNVLETLGNARVNTSIKKYGTGSMYFDGNGDVLSIVDDEMHRLTSGDFTIECWVYPTANGALYDSGFASYGAASTLAGWFFGMSGTNTGGTLNRLIWSVNYAASGGAPVYGNAGLPLNTWTHAAVTKVGTTINLFINGVLDKSATVSATPTTSTSYKLYIGAASYDPTGTQRSLTGYIDDLRITKGVARYRYSFTPPTKTFNDGDGNLATPTSDVLVGDSVNLPVFPYTTLLLHGDGTNNANNHAFVDSSTNNFAITRNGNATQGTFSPFSPTGWSMYQSDINGNFPGFTTSVGSAFQFTGDFTIEGWVYPVSYSGTGDTSLWVTSSDNINYFALNYATSNYNIYLNSGSPNSFAHNIATNQWNHVAMVRSGSTITLYTNGVAMGTLSSSATLGYATPSLARIGGGAASNVRYVSNLRIVKGTAVYTANFTPPTAPLTAVANTQLLTCQSNRFVDNSNNNFTATLTGSPSIQAFSPFAPSVEYTANTHGGSAYFDGTGDYLTTNATQAIPATGDFTVEAWIYPTISGGNRTIIAQGTSGTAGRLQFNTNTDNTLQLGIGSTIVYSTGTIVANAWNYVAFTRTGSSVAFYINGSAAGTATASGSVQNTTLAIGSEWSGDPYRWLGYIGSVRVSNVLRTINSITTAPFSNDANTVFLANFTNAGILDSTGKNVLETVGDAKVNTAIKKYGTGSMYFDGTGDWLLSTASPNLALGSGDFTIECWIRRSTPASGAGVILQMSAGTDSYSLLFGYTSSSNYVVYISSDGASWDIASAQVLGAIENDVWVHYALTRQGSTFRTFRNGIQQATWTSSSSIYQASNQVTVGRAQNTHPYVGYIDDLRITKGIARYVQNFTPPTAAFLNK